ncbi:MAG TPA: VWA domain-containing protein [Anaeromyxobacter sp.]
MSLGFANPLLLWGALAAAIPIAIHLFFRRRPRPTPFPAIDFILRARRETERRLRLKKILLFAARTLLLAAVAVALARPRLETPGEAAAAVPRGPSATAIVLDASGSMRYRLDGKTLFERARADALGALASLGADEPATLVVCGGAAPAAEPPGFDRALLRRTLERAEAEAGHSDLTACVGAAARALSDPKAPPGLGRRIVVATDLAASAWRLDVPAPDVETPQGRVRPEVSVLDAARGAPLPNAAVVGLDAEPDPAAGPRGYRVTAQLVNHGKQALADAPLQLVVGAGKEARTVIRAFVDVPAGGATRKQLSYAFPAGGPAALSVALPQDALREDDARSLVLVVPRTVRVLVVDGSPSPVRYRDEAYFVESALASPASPVRPTLVDAEALAAQDLSQFDVVFLLNVRAPAAKAQDLQRFVEQGGGLFIALGDEVDPEAWSKDMAALLPMPLHVVKTAAERGAAGARAARFADVDWDHPALSVFTGDAREGFLGVRTYRYVLAKAAGKGSAARVLATFDDGAPALVEGRRGKGRVLLFTSTADRDWTDWPIRTSFLPAMQRFAGWLAGGLDDRRDAPTLVGTARTLRLDAGEAIAALVGPDGRERRRGELDREGLREVKDGVEVTPREPGLWQVKVSAGGQEKLEPRLAFAVVPDPRESDTRRLEPSELTAWFGGADHAKVEGEARASRGARFPLWSILLVLGVAAFVLEGILLA